VAELRGVGLPDHDGTRGLETRHVDVVMIRDAVLVDETTLGVGQPLGVLEILHTQGDALQRTGLAALDALLAAFGVGQEGLAVPHRDERVQVAVGLVDSVEDGPHQLDG
jgi:hypothetical protein